MKKFYQCHAFLLIRLDHGAIILIIDDAYRREYEDDDQTSKQELGDRLAKVKPARRNNRTDILIHQIYTAYHVATGYDIHKHQIKNNFYAAREAGIGELTAKLAIKEVLNRHQRRLEYNKLKGKINA